MVKKFLICAILSLIYAICVYAQETLTITTYYPSPYGVYKRLRVYPSTDISPLAVCTNKGEMFYNDSDNQLYICNGNNWVSAGGGGDYWTLSGTNLYANDTNWNVGIGTTDLTGTVHEGTFSAKLKVAGVILANNNIVIDSDNAMPCWGSINPNNHQWSFCNDQTGIMRFTYSAAAGGPYNQYITFSPTGNVGIGTTSPAERLDISTGNIKMGYERVFNTVTGSIATVNCTGTKYVISGGCTCAGGANYLLNSTPNSNSQWLCVCSNVGGAVTAYGICAQMR